MPRTILSVFALLAIIVSAATSAPREAILPEGIKLPNGYSMTVFARDIGSPRLLQMTAGGDLIVSAMQDGRILLVKRDGDGDGASDGQIVLRDGLHYPHGILLEGETLFVAEEGHVVKYDFNGAALSNERVILKGLPQYGDHFSRTLKRGPDGFLYLSIGASCNVCREDRPWWATILRFKEGEAPEVFASGLRNTVGFDWQPKTGKLYGVDNGRDLLGDDIPDDEVNLIEEGRHYGWPYVHGAGVEDPIYFARMPAGLEVTSPVQGLGAHVAPLSLRFLTHQADVALNGSALVAEHGSRDRSVKSGYRIIRLIFDGETVREEVFLTGCEQQDKVICRPVDVIEAPDGSLYVSDDYVGAIYWISPSIPK